VGRTVNRGYARARRRAGDVVDANRPETAGERRELDTDYGKRVVGVLLFQDLAVVPLLVVVPALATEPQQLGVTLGVALAKAPS